MYLSLSVTSGDNLLEMFTKPKLMDEVDGKTKKKDDKDDDKEEDDDDAKDDKEDKKESK